MDRTKRLFGLRGKIAWDRNAELVALLGGGIDSLLFRPSQLAGAFLSVDLTLNGIVLDSDFVAMAVVNFIPFLLFQIFYGTWLYRHFCTASVYYFSRQPNRRRWFAHKAGELLVISETYFFLFLGGFSVSLMLRGARADWDGTWILCLIVWQYMALYNWSFVLAMNLCAICLGQIAGFLIVYGIEMGVLASLALYENGMLPGAGRLLYYINPVVHLIAGLHSPGRFASLWEEVGGLELVPLPLWSSFLYFGVLGTGCFLIGRKICAGVEFLNREG